jgi:hypothetical protein
LTEEGEDNEASKEVCFITALGIVLAMLISGSAESQQRGAGLWGLKAPIGDMDAEVGAPIYSLCGWFL